tara:strand:+ start:1045 stop:1413 length:369 start_codon:yes stop_codon:yes gene_type:complete
MTTNDGSTFIATLSRFDAPKDSKNKIKKNRNINFIKLLIYLFNFLKKFFAILKVGMIVLSTLISSPVLGFLAFLAALIEGEKTPKPLNSALWPLASALEISLIIISKIFSESFTEILFFSEN